MKTRSPRTRRPSRPLRAVGWTAAVAASLLCLASVPSSAAVDGDWLPAGLGITSGISGLAVAGATGTGDLLAVHDNKHAGQRRLSRIQVAGNEAQVWEVRWDGERLPVDLEALSDVPGRPGEFVALESSGRAYHLRWASGAARVLREFTVPDVAPGDNYEGFALTSSGGRLVAVWAHRGQDEDPGVLATARLDWATLAFGPRVSTPVTVPYPGQDVRHVSDVDVTSSGQVVTTAASDPGDDGPFDSAVYDLGRVTIPAGGEPVLELRAQPLRLGTFAGHKVEGVVCAPGAPSTALGSDDENLGAAVRRDDLCPSVIAP
ncbi:hypothetical protein [Streptomyces sp. NPDC048057]|uniref:hypothetical protein n=1 Tax=Streptomyces sp. NPDC048057 TaxID=3155628 RepID=UPI0033C7FBBA